MASQCCKNKFIITLEVSVITTQILQYMNIINPLFRDPDVHALVVRGEGKYFSTGHDLPWINHLTQTQRRAEVADYFQAQRKLTARMLTFPMPTVAVVNGNFFFFLLLSFYLQLVNSRYVPVFFVAPTWCAPYILNPFIYLKVYFSQLIN